MTDLLYMPILILLSWLIRQIENGIGGGGNEPDEQDDDDGENETGSEQQAGEGGGGGVGEGGRPLGIEQAEFEPYEPVTQAIKIAIAAFSLLLLGLSVSAYRKTHLRRLVYAAVAFGLFALQLFFDYLEDAIPAFDTPYSDIIFFGITLAILILFFMAIVKKK
jgi:hypothetical protein